MSGMSQHADRRGIVLIKLRFVDYESHVWLLELLRGGGYRLPDPPGWRLRCERPLRGGLPPPGPPRLAPP
eukprot:9725735-Alexandrium_andersonii.AAC.1